MEKTFEDYLRAAEQGDVEAQLQLTSCYEQGTGVLKDATQAVYWYKKAAELGLSSKLPYIFSCVYAFWGEKEKALLYLEKSFKYKVSEIDYVLNDDFWKNYLSDNDFIH